MKIAQIAPIVESVPPKKYGGTERIVYELTEELVRRGHDVTLFASGGSRTSAKLESVYPRPLREAKVEDIYGPNVWTLLNIGLAYNRQYEFDIIHDHSFYLSLPSANISTTPVVMTLHNVFTPSTRSLFEKLNNPYYVTISKSQSIPVPNLNYIGNVYNGLTMDDYPFSSEHEGYLLFVGRISIEKGVHQAIEVAQYLNLPLIIAAKLDTKDLPYFRDFIEPRLSEQIRWVGEVDEDERNKLMSKALTLLYPVAFREPFGLTMVEAMATGCPVIAFRRGSVPEIVKNGKTGFIVEDVEEMIEAITHIADIKREDCRKHSLENFNAKKMVDGYEIIYNKILQKKENHKKTASLPLTH